MRLKTKWRGNHNNQGAVKDKVKEASKRLRIILRTSRKLGVGSEDLKDLTAVGQLRSFCRGSRSPSDQGSWLLNSVLGVTLLVTAVTLVLAYGGLQDLLTCANSSTSTPPKEIQIPTIRLDRLPLDTSESGEESNLFNDSEDGEDGHLWQPPSMRLRER